MGRTAQEKLTIVDCIGRAIFGFDPQGIKSAVIDHRGTSKYKQGVVEYLLRKGETEGLIEVKFSSNGKAFRVVRHSPVRRRKRGSFTSTEGIPNCSERRRSTSES